MFHHLVAEGEEAEEAEEAPVGEVAAEVPHQIVVAGMAAADMMEEAAVVDVIVMAVDVIVTVVAHLPQIAVGLKQYRSFYTLVV
mmetsp:Transcript_9467/g.16481  ORF Transcript_9467/g.16481 Transcript_9467/m.16481 type:complete len:84 (+) Transcript_9467:191-442(+)